MTLSSDKETRGLGTIIYPVLNKFVLNKQEVLEVCQIGKFVYNVDSYIKIIDKPKPPCPDFIIEYDNKIVGLEHTRILTEDAWRYYRVKTLLDYSEQEYKRKYSNVNVHAIISVRNDDWNYSQREKPILAGKIADYVEWTRLKLDFDLPKEITKIRTTDHTEVSFSFHEKNRRIKYLTKERLKAEIEKKEAKILQYKSSDVRLMELWLVLLVGSLSSASYELNNAENYLVDSKFDRVYLMEDFYAKIIRIK